MEPSSADLQRTGGWLPLTLTCLGTVVVLVSLAVGVIATTSWQNTYELPACPPEDVSCLGQTREVVDKNPAILLLGVVTPCWLQPICGRWSRCDDTARRAGCRSPARC